MSFLFTNPFDDIVEKATSENMPIGREDIFANLEIADKIKGKEVPAKEAARSLKKRINHKNPNVQLLALKLTDTCVKNGGKHFLVEVASREFMDNLVSIAKAFSGTDPAVRTKILSLIQAWGISFKGQYDLSYVTQVYDGLKREGLPFPPIDKSETSSALIETQTAPEWSDSDVCMRCRTAFTTFNRKHHCRNCGQTFCHACSSKILPLPHLGINQEVRVCDSCHIKLTTKTSAPGTPKKRTSSMPPPISEDARRREEEEFERAIAASLAEANKSSNKGRAKSVSESKPKPPPVDEEEDEDLKAAIEASLKELKIAEERNNRPNPNRYSSSSSGSIAIAATQANPNELSQIELDNLKLFADLVERMDADVRARGIGVMQHSQIGALYAQLYALQPKLLWSLEDASAKLRTATEFNEKVAMALQLHDKMLQERLAAASSFTRSYSQDFQYAGVPSHMQPPPHQPVAAAPFGGYQAGPQGFGGYAPQQQPPPMNAQYQPPVNVPPAQYPGQQPPPGPVPNQGYPAAPQPQQQPGQQYGGYGQPESAPPQQQYGGQIPSHPPPQLQSPPLQPQQHLPPQQAPPAQAPQQFAPTDGSVTIAPYPSWAHLMNSTPMNSMSPPPQQQAPLPSQQHQGYVPPPSPSNVPPQQPAGFPPSAPGGPAPFAPEANAPLLTPTHHDQTASFNPAAPQSAPYGGNYTYGPPSQAPQQGYGGYYGGGPQQPQQAPPAGFNPQQAPGMYGQQPQQMPPPQQQQPQPQQPPVSGAAADLLLIEF